MPATDQFENLLEDLYLSAESEEHWPRFLENLRQRLDAAVANIIISDGIGKRPLLTESVGLSADAIEPYHSYWHAQDPWYKPEAEELSMVGSVWYGAALVSDEVLERSSFYQEYWRGLGLFQTMGAVVDAGPETSTLVTANFPRSSVARVTPALQLLQRLSPHLQRATRLHRRLWSLQEQIQHLGAGLDRLNCGFLVVSGSGRILYANAPAEAILSLGDALSSLDGRIVCPDPTWNARLCTAISAAVQTSSGRGISRGDVFVVPKSADGAGHRISITALSPSGSLSPGGRPAAVVTVVDLDREPLDEVRSLTALYGLTVAEARVTLELAKGRKPPEIADELRLSANTIRTHLKSIYSKTGARGQAELIRQIFAGASLTPGEEVKDCRPDKSPRSNSPS